MVQHSVYHVVQWYKPHLFTFGWLIEYGYNIKYRLYTMIFVKHILSWIIYKNNNVKQVIYVTNKLYYVLL